MAVEECLHNLQDAVETVYEVKGQKNLPEPSPLDEVVSPEDAKGDAMLLAEIDPSLLSSGAIRVNLSIPEYLLARIDKKTHEHGLSRSAYKVAALS